MLKTHYDLVIIGAGPAGLATAIATATKTSASKKHDFNTCRILVIDQGLPELQRVGENIPPQTLMLLQKLGVDGQFLQDGHEPCPGFASVWGKGVVGYNDFIVNPYGHSWRLNRQAFDLALVQKAKALGVEIHWQTRFIEASKVKPNDQIGFDICLSTKSQIAYTVRANFVVDASGAKASFAKTLKVKKTVDDKLIALVRFASLKQPHKGKQVRIEATQNNWCYHALLPQQKVVSMLISEPSEMHALKAKNYQGFNDHLASTQWVGKQLAELALYDETYHNYLITSGMLEQIEGDHWLAVGDAAASFDPISAQGIYKGLQHGLMAADVITTRLKQEESPLDYSAIIQQTYRNYQANRAYIYQQEQRWPNSSFWQNRMAI